MQQAEEEIREQTRIENKTTSKNNETKKIFVKKKKVEKQEWTCTVCKEVSKESQRIGLFVEFTQGVGMKILYLAFIILKVKLFS